MADLLRERFVHVLFCSFTAAFCFWITALQHLFSSQELFAAVENYIKVYYLVLINTKISGVGGCQVFTEIHISCWLTVSLHCYYLGTTVSSSISHVLPRERSAFGVKTNTVRSVLLPFDYSSLHSTFHELDLVMTLSQLLCCWFPLLYHPL